MALKKVIARLRRRPLTKKRLAITSTAVLVIVAVTVAGFWWLQRPSADMTALTKAETMAKQFVQALEAKDIGKVTTLARSPDKAAYYNQVALQAGNHYQLIKSAKKSEKSYTLYSFTFKANKPYRPGTTYLRIIIKKQGTSSFVDGFQANMTQPSGFPASASPTTEK